MFSIVGSIPAILVRNHVYLLRDRWDDWGKFCTQFSVHAVDATGEIHSLGSVKIGEIGLKPRNASAPQEQGFRSPTLHEEFEKLDESHFSLGQGENYYETLNGLNDDFKFSILSGLRDCALDVSIFEKHAQDEVMTESLLRGVQERNVRNRYHRLALGNAALTKFEFKFDFPKSDNAESAPSLSFKVAPDTEPPTNVHVLIGRNGVGKTRCIQNLLRTVLNGKNPDSQWGELTRLGSNADEWSFAGVVSVSFSVFDDFDLPAVQDSGIRTAQIGLRYKAEIDGKESIQVKTPDMLAQDFVESLEQCRSGPRAKRWRQALATLEADPLFKESNASELIHLEESEWKAAATRLFRRLSSGHAIVLLTMTRLVELVDERTLVILDEPEGHLHPPLLSALVRAVADLLGKRNGVALVATHSPVVLQEVPQTCVWKLRRSGVVSRTERPTIETFGENVGILTNEVFGLEVTRSGFHELLVNAVRSNSTYEDVLEHFSNQLGSEARSIVRGLIAVRDTASN